ncbi:MAG: response regulator [Woeseiaceae bacterium]
MNRKARILFVDDEKRVLNAMRGLFRREHELYLANDGAEAVQLAAENDIDVIVADQRMPGMTGVEVLAKIKQHSPRTVRILLTGYADPAAIEGSINIGEVFRFLSKPCPPALLRETLTLAIEASHTEPVAPSPPPAAAEPEPEPRPVAAPTPVVEPVPVAEPAAASAPTPIAEPTPVAAPTPVAETTPDDATISDNDETQPALQVIDLANPPPVPDEHEETHWHTVTNVVLSEDKAEETHNSIPAIASAPPAPKVGVVVFTVDSEFAATVIRAVSTERETTIATTLIKVAETIARKKAGVLITDFTTNKQILQKIIGALKQRLPELVTITVSDGRDSEDMINLINFGQVFRYAVKPIDSHRIRNDINAAVVRHAHLLENPESAKRHQVANDEGTADPSSSVEKFLGKVRSGAGGRVNPVDTIT